MCEKRSDVALASRCPLLFVVLVSLILFELGMGGFDVDTGGIELLKHVS